MSPGKALTQFRYDLKQLKKKLLTIRCSDRNTARALSAVQNNKKKVNNAKVQTTKGEF